MAVRFVLVVAACVLLAAPVQRVAGHSYLEDPEARDANEPVPFNNGGNKGGPCGNAPGNAGNGVTALPAGATYTVRAVETIDHSGSPYRIAICGLANPTLECFDNNILLNHVPHDDSGQLPIPREYDIEVNIPDVNCPAGSCWMQLLQVMTDKPQTGCQGCYGPDWVTYYSCSEISIAGTTPIAQYTHTYNPTYPGLDLPQGFPFGDETGTWTDNGGVLELQSVNPINQIARDLGGECPQECEDYDQSENKDTGKKPGLSAGVAIGVSAAVVVVGAGAYFATQGQGKTSAPPPYSSSQDNNYGSKPELGYGSRNTQASGRSRNSNGSRSSGKRSNGSRSRSNGSRSRNGSRGGSRGNGSRGNGSRGRGGR